MKLNIQMFADKYTFLATWGTYYINSGTNIPLSNDSMPLDLKANYNISYLQKNGKTVVRIQPVLRAYSLSYTTDWNLNIKVYARVTNSTSGNTYKYTTVHIGQIASSGDYGGKSKDFYGNYIDFEVAPDENGKSNCAFGGYVTYNGITRSCYNTYNLPTINMPSKITNNTLENSRIAFGQTITFNAVSQNSNIINVLTYSVDNTTYSVGTITGNGTLQYTFSTDLINKFTNTDVANITVNCSCSNGTVTSTNVYLKVPENYIPTIALSIEDVGQSQFSDLWILYKSKLKGTISANGIAGSTIKSYSSTISNFNQTYNSNPFTTQNLSVSGKRVITSKVTDSRNRSVTITKEITVIDYHVPTYVETKVERCNSDGTINNEGSYAKVTCKYKISPINNLNIKKIKIKKDNGNEQTFNLTDYDGTYSSVLFSGILNSQQYEFQFTLIDSFGETTPQVFTLPTSETLVSKLNGGKGITFGRIATEEGFHVYMDANFHDGLKINGVSISSLYPVGSIYLSVNDTNPSTFFGGTWERIQDKFLLAAGSSYQAGTAGGSETHKHTIAAHSHGISKLFAKIHNTAGKFRIQRKQTSNYSTDVYVASNAGYVEVKNDNTYGTEIGGSIDNSDILTTNDGSSMPPFLAVYVWKRIS